MEKREAARITLEVRERVNARVSNPEDIHLHLQQFGVTPREENVVAGGVAKLFKLAHVVVVTKLDAGIARELATLVEEVGEAFPAVGADALVVGHHNVLPAESLRLLEALLPIVGALGGIEEAARARQAIGGDSALEIRDAEIHGQERRRLYFSVARRRNVFQDILWRLGKEVSDGVHLEPDGPGPGQPSRSRALTVSHRSAERGRPNRFLQKISAVFHVVSYLGDAIKSHATGRVNGSL